MFLIFIIFNFSLSLSAKESKLLTFEVDKSKKLVAELSKSRVTLRNNSYSCHIKISDYLFQKIEGDRFDLRLHGATFGCDRLIGRNQLIDIQIDNYNLRDKTGRELQVVYRFYDEVESRKGEIDFVNIDLLQAAFK